MSDLPRLQLTRALRGDNIDELRGALKVAVAELQAYSLRITRINEITLSVSRAPSLEPILEVLWSQARWVVDYEHFEVALRRGGAWWRIVHRGAPPGDPLDGHPLVEDITRGRPGVHRGVSLAEGDPFGSVMLVPMVSESEAIGALIFARRRVDAYTGDDLRIASMLGLQLAAVVRNAERYDELQVLTGRLDALNRRRRELLANMLPEVVADELIRAGSVEPVHFDCATVMFIDFVGFTASSAEMSPKLLLDRLDELFTAFDGIIASHGLEKLKTIGDAYMCVGGVPVPWTGHPQATIAAAGEIIDYVDELRRSGEKVWPVRIGVHAGPLIAGIIGSHKYAYDVWGDTVNLAARLEAASEPGRINVSAAVRSMVAPMAQFVSRGKRPVKGVGEVEMFYVDTRQQPRSHPPQRITVPLSVTPRQQRPIEGSALRVLVIDDDPTDVVLVRRALRGAAIEVIERSSLDAVAEQADAPDVVLLDLKLTQTIGVETLIQARALLGETPIVVLTGMDDDAIGVEAVRYGADDYLQKGPRDMPRLERVLRRAVARAEFRRGSANGRGDV